MKKKSSSPDFPPLSQLVSALSATAEEHLAFLQTAIPEDRIPIDAEDHLVVATLRRSLDNIQGFLAMAEQRNVFCGMPIIRFQLDTAMRLFGRTLVADVNAYVEHMARGKKLSDLTDRRGKLLTDTYLHKQLTKKHSDVSSLYKETSGYVHFSTHHLHRVLDLDRYALSGEMLFEDPEEMTVGWSDQEVRGALVCMLWATDAILSECKDWAGTRPRP
jgi:hypothetical protein